MASAAPSLHELIGSRVVEISPSIVSRDSCRLRRYKFALLLFVIVMYKWSNVVITCMEIAVSFACSATVVRHLAAGVSNSFTCLVELASFANRFKCSTRSPHAGR